MRKRQGKLLHSGAERRIYFIVLKGFMWYNNYMQI